VLGRKFRYKRAEVTEVWRFIIGKLLESKRSTAFEVAQLVRKVVTRSFNTVFTRARYWPLF
jgi:hypothetical protein